MADDTPTPPDAVHQEIAALEARLTELRRLADRERLTQSGAEHAHGRRALGPGDPLRGKAAVLVADLPFQRHLAALERGCVAACSADLVDLADRGTQLRQRRG